MCTLYLAYFAQHSNVDIQPCSCVLSVVCWAVFLFNVHSPVVRYLGCSQYLVIISTATMNTCVPVFTRTCFHFGGGVGGKNIGVEWLRHMVSICLTF